MASSWHDVAAAVSLVFVIVLSVRLTAAEVLEYHQKQARPKRQPRLSDTRSKDLPRRYTDTSNAGRAELPIDALETLFSAGSPQVTESVMTLVMESLKSDENLARLLEENLRHSSVENRLTAVHIIHMAIFKGRSGDRPANPTKVLCMYDKLARAFVDGMNSSTANEGPLEHAYFSLCWKMLSGSRSWFYETAHYDLLQMLINYDNATYREMPLRPLLTSAGVPLENQLPSVDCLITWDDCRFDMNFYTVLSLVVQRNATLEVPLKFWDQVKSPAWKQRFLPTGTRAAPTGDRQILYSAPAELVDAVYDNREP